MEGEVEEGGIEDEGSICPTIGVVKQPMKGVQGKGRERGKEGRAPRIDVAVFPPFPSSPPGCDTYYCPGETLDSAGPQLLQFGNHLLGGQHQHEGQGVIMVCLPRGQGLHGVGWVGGWW